MTDAATDHDATDAATALPALRTTILEIERWRGEALDAFARAFDTLDEAQVLAGRAHGGHSPRHYQTLGIGSKYGRDGCETNREAFLSARRRDIDAGIWQRMLDHMGLEKLMDAQARADFRKRLHDDPPEATAENVFATMSTLVEDAGLIFRRGLANAFSGLDRRFRSHDGFKIGSRICLTWATSEGGYLNERPEATIRDVERVFCVLAGVHHPTRVEEGSIIKALEDERRHFHRRGLTVESPFFRLRTFKNGNAHLWFKRDDLVEKVNQLLAEYYGEALGEGADTAAANAPPPPSTAVAKNMGWFPSPPAVVAAVIEEAADYGRRMEGLRVLEPSAGEGALALAARKAGATVECVELHPVRADTLRRAGFVTCQGDFLHLKPADLDAPYDRIIMNPPFDRGLAIAHVLHALAFLAPGGKLVAVMPAGAEFAEGRRADALRAALDRGVRTRWQDLPPGSFASAGTNVNTSLLVYQAPATPKRTEADAACAHKVA